MGKPMGHCSPCARRPGSRGFALIGVLIMVAVLGAASVASLALGSLMQRVWAEEQLLYVGAQYQAALAAYFNSTPLGQPRFPLRLEDLLRDPRYPGVRRYLRQLYPDPVTGRNDWELVMAPEGGIMGVHSVSTARPAKQSGFPAGLVDLMNKDRYCDWRFIFHP